MPALPDKGEMVLAKPKARRLVLNSTDLSMSIYTCLAIVQTINTRTAYLPPTVEKRYITHKNHSLHPAYKELLLAYHFQTSIP